MFGKNEQQPDFEIFVVYDTKSQTYGTPIFQKNHLTVIRDITNLFNQEAAQPKNELYVNAEDFSVFRIGSYSKATGQISVQKHEHIANLHDLRALVQREKPVQGTEMGIVRT